MVSRQKRARRFQLGLTRVEESGGLGRLFQGASLRATLVVLLFVVIQILALTLGLEEKLAPADLAGISFLVLGAHVVGGLYLSRYEKPVLESVGRLTDLLLLVTGLLVVARLVVKVEWPVLLVPLPLVVALLAIGIGRRAAVFFGFLLTPFVVLAHGLQAAARSGELAATPLGLDPVLLLTLGAGAFVYGISVDRSSSRSRLIAAGFWTGGAMFAVHVASRVLFGEIGLRAVIEAPGAFFAQPAWALGAGVVTGYVVAEFGVKFVEAAFGVLTDIRLGELSDLNRPFFKRFNLEAPGTFHHSQVVADFAEEAATAIGANHKLVRVGAYYHDIGKLMHPGYFTENMRGGESPHDTLTPKMSSLIIIAHVKDGIEMARELGLPDPIVDFIPEHHGTQAVEYFYRQALKDENDALPKDAFRYPGPTPRSRESAILMIADTVEAVSRTLEDPTPARVESLVHDIVMSKLTQGQFDECPLTLWELKGIEEAMTRSLIAAHHQRISYPEEPSETGVPEVGETPATGSEPVPEAEAPAPDDEADAGEPSGEETATEASPTPDESSPEPARSGPDASA